MGRIYRTNVFTGEKEWADFEGGVEVLESGWETERKTYSTAWTRPHESQAAACHSSQVNEMNEFYRARGITGAYHRPDGTLLSEDRNQFNRVLKERGLRNQDAGYGDYAGR